MKKLFYRFVTSRSFAKLVLISAFVVLGVALAQEALAGYWCQKNGTIAGLTCTSPNCYCSCTSVCNTGFTRNTTRSCPASCTTTQPTTINGGSTLLKYDCEGQGTNTLAYRPTPADPDTFVSEGDASCNFTGEVKGTGISCEYNLTWTGDLVKCDDSSGDAVVTLGPKCRDNFSVSGTLSCPAQNSFPAVTDVLGISSSSECVKLWGKTTKLLDYTLTFSGQNCSQVLTSTQNEDFVLAGLTNTAMKICHSDGALEPDCITQGGTTNKATSDQRNLAQTTCVAYPQNWNADCSGNKDQGNGSVCYVNEAPGFTSFDPTELDCQTATVNGFPATRCRITDCNGDGNPDFRVTVDTCSANNFIAPGGVLTMTTNFKGDTGGLTCTTTVGTSGG